MSAFGIPASPANRALAATVARRITADARMVAATATFWRLLGLGGLLLLTGLGAGAAFLGYAHIVGPNADSARMLSAAIAEALDKVTLKTDGHVALDTKDATVRLDASGATVRLDARDMPQPSERQLAPNAQPDSKTRVVTNYTIFKTVQFSQGEIVTGWNYQSSENPAPSGQACFYLRNNRSGATRYDIATNGVFNAVLEDRPAELDLQQAFANCVWWR
jgi:hypothetical protein